YEKGNIEWATKKKQAENRRDTHWVTFQNRTQTVTYWSRETGIQRLTLRRRLKAGWTIEEALTVPLQTHRFWRTKHSSLPISE
ncbi:hypothetical protein, partial [Escherichia coli]|uniref:hypothetical protein n=1 Tax=Escherichia coli TaxID=562 RepID=UPI003855A6A3